MRSKPNRMLLNVGVCTCFAVSFRLLCFFGQEQSLFNGFLLERRYDENQNKDMTPPPKKKTARNSNPKVRMQTRNRTAHDKLNMLTDSSSPSNRTCLSSPNKNGPRALTQMNCNRLMTEFTKSSFDLFDTLQHILYLY